MMWISCLGRRPVRFLCWVEAEDLPKSLQRPGPMPELPQTADRFSRIPGRLQLGMFPEFLCGNPSQLVWLIIVDHARWC
jgi:hypothetical protein